MPRRWGPISFVGTLLSVGALNVLRHYNFSELSAWISAGMVSIVAFVILRAYVFPDRDR